MTKNQGYRDQEVVELNILNLADLKVEGLDRQRLIWKIICVHGNSKQINDATNKYVMQIEEATNQPIEMVLKKSQFVNLNDAVIIDRDPGKNAMIRMRDDDATGKSLHEKAKSSVHGYSLAGYIPFDQAFGKAGDDGRTDRFNKIVADRFSHQHDEDKVLTQVIDQLNSGKPLSKEQQKELDQVIEKMPVAKTQLKDAKGREIYDFRNGEEKPIFAYKEGDHFINETTEKPVTLPQGKEFKKIEVLSYITGVEQNKETGKYQPKTQKITGDHDQLAIGTKASRGNTLQDKELSGDKGFADSAGHAVTAALIDETKKSGAVRHGQDAGGAGTKDSLSKKDLKNITEALTSTTDIKQFLANKEIKEIAASKLGGNPYPENFAEGKYAVYIPDGKVEVARSEAEIVEKYNKLEQQGYNIGINPNYGWTRDKENKLQIDPNKISAQDFLNAKVAIEKEMHQHISQAKLPEERANEIIATAHTDADNLYKMNSILTLTKLQTDSPEKRAAVEKSTKMLQTAEDQYAENHGQIPPTVSAMVNEKNKQVRLNKINNIIKAQNVGMNPAIRTRAGSLDKLYVPKLDFNASKVEIGGTFSPSSSASAKQAPRKITVGQ